MLSDVLKRRGQAFVEELELAPDQSTEKWMAHYLAELMQRADNSTEESERSEIAQQCSELIIALWEQRKRKTGRQLYSAINDQFYEVYYRRPFVQVMKELIAEPSQTFEEMDEVLTCPPKNWLLFMLCAAKESAIVNQKHDGHSALPERAELPSG